MPLFHSYKSSQGQSKHLLRQFRGIDSNIVGIEIATLYFLALKDGNTSVEAEQIPKIQRLLDLDNTYGGQGWPWQSEQNNLLYVVPRQGTISPWSSKATDIFHLCNVDLLARVECGFCYKLQLNEAIVNQSVACDDAIKEILHDRMTEVIYSNKREIEDWLAVMQLHESLAKQKQTTKPLEMKNVRAEKNKATLQSVSNLIKEQTKGLGLTDEELSRLEKYYYEIQRQPTDAELMMYAQVNSEHCRHKLFNAHWLLDSKLQAHSLFEMIKSTRHSEDIVVSAYEDNASTIWHNETMHRLLVDSGHCYHYHESQSDRGHFFLIKVETHNHPTAISPFAGAATGSGGEIRDESAAGRGGRPHMGLVGYTVSNLHIPDFEQAWEKPPKYPERIASALQIITEGPLGAARFNNEFGRPCVCGYFRTYEQQTKNHHWGYHKPIMIAGGLGSIREEFIDKERFGPDTPLVVFGGPAMRIGLGGGSASSLSSGSSSHELDFASVQRDNAEMQRRAQEVIEQCTADVYENPLLSIHDVGAGGLANALPELVHGADLGAQIDLRNIPCADSTLSAMEIWCNESQERYVAAIDEKLLDKFTEICKRERCPMAVIGKATLDKTLVLEDTHYSKDTLERTPVNMSMAVLFEKPPEDNRPLETVKRSSIAQGNWQDIDLGEAVERVLKMPAVASKSFLITIGDRTVTGLVYRDPMVGPWQVPVADAAVSASDYNSYSGAAMAMGERTPVAVLNAPASGRLAVAEAILNILSADVEKLNSVCLSANWMAAANLNEQRFELYQTVQAVTDLCKALGVPIPVGKDSLSMQTQWQAGGQQHEVTSPLSLIVSAFAPVANVALSLTPQLNTEYPEKRIFLIDLSGGDNRLGGSCLLQAYQRTAEPPDIDDPQRLIDFSSFMRKLREHPNSDDDSPNILAYHDCSDGGLLVALMEMAYAANCGVCCELGKADELLPTLFSEAPGVLVQLNKKCAADLHTLIEPYKQTLNVREIGSISEDKQFEVKHQGQSWQWDLMQLKRWWSETSAHIQVLRDDSQCAAEEMERVCDANDPGLSAEWDFELMDSFADDDKEKITDSSQLPALSSGGGFSIQLNRPAVAIVREQGVNGHLEMAAAFDKAGFFAFDIHMSDLIDGEVDLKDFQGLAACGGFSYGDALGAGAGWAHSILMHQRVRENFETFFNRPDTFTLGVCNGCQMLSRIKEIIPGAAHWPNFERNRSEQFEARLVKVEITPSPSVLFSGMDGARLPIVVAHGEGQAVFSDQQAQKHVAPYTCLHYIDNYNRTTEHYPENPNGSPQGVTAFCSIDGRATIMMPHPERLFRTLQYSWHPPEWDEVAPWFKLFENAHRFCR